MARMHATTQMKGNQVRNARAELTYLPCTSIAKASMGTVHVLQPLKLRRLSASHTKLWQLFLCSREERAMNIVVL